MASIIQIGEKWRAQVRKSGVRETKTFGNRKDAEAWAQALESEAERKRVDALLEVATRARKPWDSLDPHSLPKFDHERFCGVYFLFDKGELVYVGQTVSVPRRVQDHFVRVGFDSWSWLQVPSDKLLEAETHLIRKFKPRLNYMHNRPRRGKRLAMPVPEAA